MIYIILHLLNYIFIIKRKIYVLHLQSELRNLQELHISYSH